MSSVIRSLMIKVGADLTEMEKSLKKTQKSLKNWGKNTKEIGDTLTKGLTIPALALAGGLGTLSVKAADFGDDVITLARKTGLTTDQIQQLQYATRFVDVELETMTSSMFRLTKNMDQARGGTGKQADAFKTLGVEITNVDGTLRDTNDVWTETIDALNNVANEAERDAIAYQLFGRSAQELNPLIAVGAEELKKFMQEAKTLGIVIKEDDVVAMGDLKDKLDKLGAAFDVAKTKIGIAFAPVLEKATDFVLEKGIPAIEKFAGWMQELIGKYEKLDPEQKKFITTLVGIIVAAGPVLSMLGSMALGISALLTPMGLVTAAILIIIGLAAWVIFNWEKVKVFFIDLWNAMKQPVIDFKNAIINAIQSIIAWWDNLVGRIQRVIDKIKTFVSEQRKAANSFFATGVPGYASGTVSARRGWAWVGEAGPELVKFNGGETVLNNKDSMRLMGGGDVVITGNTFNVRSDSDIRAVANELYKLQVKAGRG